MSSSSGPSSAPSVSWSTEVGQADWIAERLFAADRSAIASIVPDGFDAYSRLLHPITLGTQAEGITVRWSEVAEWSGRGLERDSQFHAIAVSGQASEEPPPWESETPRQGSMEPDDARALIDVLGRHTDTADR
ncbi:MAG TPA: hypothetical protein VHZ02_00450, partial [Acidimicrobiales bacterium]|nr:hypothetical protein [Acidimicrobiales bacterium]